MLHVEGSDLHVRFATFGPKIGRSESRFCAPEQPLCRPVEATPAGCRHTEFCDLGDRDVGFRLTRMMLNRSDCCFAVESSRHGYKHVKEKSDPDTI
jgi:hypothetical protein